MVTADQAICIGVTSKEVDKNSVPHNRRERNDNHAVQLSAMTIPTVQHYTASRLSAHAWQNLCIMLTGCTSIFTLATTPSTQESATSNTLYDIPSNTPSISSAFLALSFCLGVYALSRVSRYLSSTLEHQSYGWHTDLAYRRACTLPSGINMKIPHSRSLTQDTEKIYQIISSNPGDEEFLLAGISNRLNSLDYKDSIFLDFIINAGQSTSAIESQFNSALSYMLNIKSARPVIASFKVNVQNTDQSNKFVEAWNNVHTKATQSSQNPNSPRVLFLTINSSLQEFSAVENYNGVQIDLTPTHSKSRSLLAFEKSRQIPYA